MSFIPDIIVFIWLLPVIAQIVLPLAMLAAWLANFFVARIFGRREAVAKPVVRIGEQARI